MNGWKVAIETCIRALELLGRVLTGCCGGDWTSLGEAKWQCWPSAPSAKQLHETFAAFGRGAEDTGTAGWECYSRLHGCFPVSRPCLPPPVTFARRHLFLPCSLQPGANHTGDTTEAYTPQLSKSEAADSFYFWALVKICKVGTRLTMWTNGRSNKPK